MCYAAPGPRCSAHAKTAYSKAQTAYAKDQSEENKKALNKAAKDYMTTPAGIKTLERLAERETDADNKKQLSIQASKAREARKRAIEEYKKATGEEVKEEQDTIVRPSEGMRRNLLETSYLDSSAQKEKAAQDSYERSDTDGALSQFANSRMSDVDRYKAQLAQQGGLSEFQALYDTEGNIVPAVKVSTKYGEAWGLVDKDNPGNHFKGFFNPSKAQDEEKAKANDAKKGYYLGTAIAPAKADIVGGGGGIVTTYASIVPRNRRMDDKVIPVDNGMRSEEEMDKLREDTYSTAYKQESEAQAKRDAEDKKRLDALEARQAEAEKHVEKLRAENAKKVQARKEREKRAEAEKEKMRASLNDTSNCAECKSGSPVPHFPNARCRVGGFKAHCTCAACF